MAIKEGGNLSEFKNSEAETGSYLTEKNNLYDVSEANENPDKDIEEGKENNNELDKKEEKGFLATLLSFIKSIISLFVDYDEKGEDIEKKPAHSFATEEGRGNAKDKNYEPELNNEVGKVYDALDKLLDVVKNFNSQKEQLEEKNTAIKSTIQNDMNQESGGDKKNQKDKAKEILKNNEKIEKLNLRITTLMKKHQQLLDKIEDVFDQEDEQEVRNYMMQEFMSRDPEIAKQADDMMQQLEAEVYQERLDKLTNEIGENKNEIRNIDQEMEKLLSSISDNKDTNETHQENFNKLLDKKEKLTQENNSNEKIIEIITEDAIEGGFVKALGEKRENNNQISK
jgi:hypothetical protein